MKHLLRRTVVASLLAFGGIVAACGGSDSGPAPVFAPLDSFVPVRVTTTSAEGFVHSVFLTGNASGVLTGNGPVIEALLVFPDKSTMYIATEGSREAPTATIYKWDGQSLRIDETTGAAVYKDGNGAEEAFTVSTDAIGSSSQALTAAEADAQDEQVSKDIRWFAEGRHSPQWGYLLGKYDKLKETYDKLQAIASKATSQLAEAFTVYTSKPIPTSAATPDPVALIQELQERSEGKAPSSNDLPEEVERRESKESSTFVPSSYEPPRVPCRRSFGEGRSTVREQSACAASREACEAAGGVAASLTEGCRDWCTSLGGGPRVAEASSGADISSLVCYQRECVDDFSKSADEFEAFRGEAACSAGCQSELCEGGGGGGSGGSGGGGTLDEQCKSKWTPLLFGQTWKVTKYIEYNRIGYEYGVSEGEIISHDRMIDGDWYNNTFKEMSFEITSEGRVRERRTHVDYQGKEHSYDSWVAHPEFATDPVEKRFKLFSSLGSAFDKHPEGRWPAHCFLSELGGLVSLEGKTLFVVRDKGLTRFADEMTLVREE